MIITGEFDIPAERARVWEALNDPDILKDCIPGCETIEKISETDLTARVRAKVGPISSRFSTKITLSDIDPPAGYTISGEGKGGPAGFARGGAQVSLEENGVGTTLRYKAEVQVGGKLAQVGSRLIEGTARKLSDEFFATFAQRLSPAPELAPVEAAVAAPPAGKEAAPRWLLWGALGVAALLVLLWLLLGR
jgi:carbon monoxide dehydrogenase subunit G